MNLPRPSLFLVVITVLLALLAPPARLPAATLTWTNTAGGTWSTAANWSPNAVPGAADTANITTPGTYTVLLDVHVTLDELVLGGNDGLQKLRTDGNPISLGSGRVMTNGLLELSSRITGERFLVEAGGTLDVVGPAYLESLVFENYGLTMLSGGNLGLFGTPPTVVTNWGNWSIQGDFRLQGSEFQLQEKGRFTNFGKLEKSAGTGGGGISLLDANLHGEIDVTSGVFRLAGWGERWIGATVTVAAGCEVDLYDGTFRDAGGIFLGPGRSYFREGFLFFSTNTLPGLQHVGGTILLGPSFQAAGAITNLTLEGSTLHGQNQVIGSGFLSVSNSFLTGDFTVQDGGVIQFLGETNSLSDCSIVNNGTVSLIAGRLICVGSQSSSITNNGNWDIQGDWHMSDKIGGARPSFQNGGTIFKSSGSGTATINGFDMRLAGAMEVNAGSLIISGFGNRSLEMSAQVKEGATLIFRDGNVSGIDATFSGAGTSRFDSGTLTLVTNILTGLQLAGGTIVPGQAFQDNGVITNLTLQGPILGGANNRLGGDLFVHGGGLAGKLTVLPEGILELSGGGRIQLYNLMLINEGVINWTGVNLSAGRAQGTTITNLGLWNIQHDGTFNYDILGTKPRLVNKGVIRRYNSSGTLQINGFDMVLEGVIQIDTGRLYIAQSGNRSLGAAVHVSAGAHLDLVEGNYFDAGGTFHGDGIREFRSGILTLNTNALDGLKLGGGFVILGPSFQQAGAITNLTLDGSLLSGNELRVGNGALRINSGGLTGKLTVQHEGNLHFVTGGYKSINGLMLLNLGTIHHSGGTVFHGGNPTTVITNAGLWDIQGDVGLDQDRNWPHSQWVNTGTLRKSGGVGTAQLDSLLMTNTSSGIIQSETGILRLPDNYTHVAGILRLTGGGIEATGIGFTGGTLEGTGSYGGGTFLGGTISPGLNGPGKLTFTAGLNLGQNVTVALDAAGMTPETEHDQLVVTGVVGITNSALQFTTTGGIPIGSKLIVITNDSTDAINGTFSGKPEAALFDSNLQLFRIRYAEGSGNDLAIVRDDGGVRLTGIQLNSTGQFEFRGLGTNGVTYAIYASPSVPTNNWTFLGNSTADVSGNFLFTDPEAAQFPRRFYQSLEPSD